MQNSETLYLAADHIDLYGHRKFGLGSAGEPTCAMGALLVVTAGRPWDHKVATPAAALRNYVGGMIHEWNNAPERTASEVVETLRACAVIEQSRERELAGVTA